MRIKNAEVFLPEGRFTRCDVAFSDTIEQIGRLDGPADLDAEGCYLIPGLVDIHTHGAMGCDFSDGDPEKMHVMARYYADHGITDFLATTMTMPESEIAKAAGTIGAFDPEEGEANCLGVHLEGPFFSYEKRGAHNAVYLAPPDAEMVRRINRAAQGKVRMVDVAPELPGADAFIREMSKECTVSLAHSTADYDTAVRGFKLGATEATHLFNGMMPFLHRAPGLVGAAMDQGAYAELICDGIHIHPSVIRAVFAMFPDRVVIISDSVRCAGMPEGTFELGSQTFTLKNGKATLADGTIAGSCIALSTGLSNAVRFGIPLETAVASATIHPAKAIRMDGEVGAIAQGRRANLVLLNADLSIRAVFLRGKLHAKQPA